MQAARTRAGRWVTLVALVGLQATWVLQTVGQEGLATAGVAYHQVPAFGAWFFAGCLIGQLRREQGSRALALAAGVLAWCALGLLLVMASTPVAGAELVGWRGLLLPLACVGTVWVSGQLRVESPSALAGADLLGRLTYGVYLIHPLVYFGLAWFIWPGAQAAAQASTLLGLGVTLGAVLITCLLAVQGYRWIEAPFQRLAKGLLQMRGS